MVPDLRTRFDLRPTIILSVAFLILLVRAAYVEANACDECVLSTYTLDTLEIWLYGVLVLGLFGIPLTLSRGVGRLAWSLALWTTFLAWVMPRESNFFANGGTDDAIFVYSPVLLIALQLALLSPSVRAFSVTLAVTAFVACGLFTWQGGFGME